MNKFFRGKFVHWLRHGARLIDGSCMQCISEACDDLRRNGISVEGIATDGLGGAHLYAKPLWLPPGAPTEGER